MKITDESMWKQALAKAASKFYHRSIAVSCLAGEVEQLEKTELDTSLLPSDYQLDELPDTLMEYAYSIESNIVGYALVSEDCSDCG